MGVGAPPETRPARPPWGPPARAAQPPQAQTLPLAGSSLGHGAELGLCWDPTECWGCRGGSNPQTLPRWKGLCWGEVLLVPSSQPCSLKVPGAGGMSTSVASSGIKIGTPPLPIACRGTPVQVQPGTALGWRCSKCLGQNPTGVQQDGGPGCLPQAGFVQDFGGGGALTPTGGCGMQAGAQPMRDIVVVVPASWAPRGRGTAGGAEGCRSRDPPGTACRCHGSLPHPAVPGPGL